jgi:RimJ/RimL family protein N-acetyltransferase
MFETERVDLRPLKRGDRKRLAAILRNEEVMALALGGAMSARKARDFIEANFRAADSGEPRLLVAWDRALRKVIGFAGYLPLDTEVGTGEVEFGFVLDAAFQHRGYGAEIAHALVQFGMQSHARLFARCHPQNAGSINILRMHLRMRRIRRPAADPQTYGPRQWYVITRPPSARCVACDKRKTKR